MKTRGKAALAMISATLLICASVMGTMAYLTSQAQQVRNTFTVGDNVVITLDEVKVDQNGETVVETDKVTQKTPRVNANSYKLMPGHKYTKDPTVHVNGEDCYVFVKVENDISTLEDAGDTTIAAQMATYGWQSVAGADNVYYYAEATANGETTTYSPKIAKKNDELVVFKSFTLEDNLTSDSFNGFAAETDANNNITAASKDIVINAYAIQADGFAGKTAVEIWTASGFGSAT